MVSKMNLVTFMELFFCFFCEMVIGCMLCHLFYLSIQLKKYLFSSICIIGLMIMCVLIFKICLFPFWKHFKPVNFIDRDIISATVNKKESEVILGNRGPDIYRIVAYYNEHSTTYIFKDVFYYNDRLFAKCIKKIIENEELPQINIVIEKNNMKKYKMKSCEYIYNLKYDFFEYFI